MPRKLPDPLAHYYSLEAEQGLLGSALVAPDLLPLMRRDGAGKALFFHSPHRVLWLALEELLALGRPIDFVTVTTYLRDKDLLDAVGGAAAISQHYTYTPTAANWKAYHDTLREKAERRLLRTRSADVLEKSGTLDLPSLRNLVHAMAVDSAAMSLSAGAMRQVGDIVRDYVDTLDRVQSGEEKRDWLEMGLPSFEKATNGMTPGALTTIGAQTAVGKTAFALQAAWHIAHKLRRPALFLSLEMSAQQLAPRIIASCGDIAMGKLLAKVPAFDADELERLGATVLTTNAAPLTFYIPDATPTAADLVSLIRSHKLEHPDLAFVAVDYLQLLLPANPKDNREQQVSQMASTLARAAIANSVAVMALSQLNEDGALRESRATAHHSRCVAYLEVRPEDNERLLRVAKVSQGHAGQEIVLRFDGAKQIYCELVEGQEEPEEDDCPD